MGERSRQKLVEATATLLRARGYHGTGRSQIIEASGAPRGSLYFHFPGGKEALAAMALSLAGAAMRDELAAVLDAAPTLAEGAREVCREMARQLVDSDYQYGCPIATVALEAAAESDELHRVCASSYGAWRGLLEERLARLGVAPDHAAELATFGLAAVEGGMLLCKAERSPRPLEVVGDQLAALIALVIPA